MLVDLRGMGLGDQEILERYPDLIQADLAAAWAYERQHREEIAEAIRLNDEA